MYNTQLQLNRRLVLVTRHEALFSDALYIQLLYFNIVSDSKIGVYLYCLIRLELCRIVFTYTYLHKNPQCNYNLMLDPE